MWQIKLPFGANEIFIDVVFKTLHRKGNKKRTENKG